MSKTTEAQSKLGLVPIPRATMQTLIEAGIAAETVGLQRLGAGSATFTLEGAQEVKQDLVKAILAADDPESKAALSNAWANVVKSEASTLKVIGCLPSAHQEGSRKQRKSFAPAAPIDVNPQPKI